jgi:hypothetical protein
LPHQGDLGGGQAVAAAGFQPLAFSLELALQLQGFCGEGAGGRAEKLILGKQKTESTIWRPTPLSN